MQNNNGHDNYKNKTLLYLDARELPCERIAEIKAGFDNGYDIIMVSPSIEPYRSYGFSHLISAPVGQYDEAEEIILTYLNKHKIVISGILVWKDREVELAARLCEKLGLPCTSVEAAKNVRNKTLTRQALNSVASANPRYAIVHDEASFLAGLKEVGTPSLIKPAGNSGSRGIFKIASINEALETYRKFRQYNATAQGDMYSYYKEVASLEEEVSGSEHSVAGAVVDGEVVIFSIMDKKFNRNILMQYQNITPSALSEGEQNAIIAMTRAAVESVGINWCGFHADVMQTQSGPKILEIGGRLGGELINSHLIPLSQPHLKPYHALMEIVQGKNPFDKNDYTRDAVRRAGSRIITPPYPGKIKQITGLERIWRHSHVRLFMQMHGVGNEMRLPQDKFKAYEIGYIVAECSLEENIELVLDEIASLVTVEVEALVEEDLVV